MLRAAAVVAALAYGTWAVQLPPFSGLATVAVVGAGVVAMAMAMAMGGIGRGRRPASGVERPAAASVAPWAALTAGAATWQLVAFLQSPRAEHPTLSALANSVLDSHPARTLAFVLWVVAAWALARR